MGLRILGIYLHCAFKGSDRLFEVSLFAVDGPDIIITLGIVRQDLNGLLIFGERFVQLTFSKIDDSQIVMDFDIVWIDFKGLLKLQDCLFQVSSLVI